MVSLEDLTRLHWKWENVANASAWLLNRAWLNFLLVYAHVRAFFKTVSVPSDTKVAAGVGLALGLGVIVGLTLFPGEPFDYSTGTVPADPRKIKAAVAEQKRIENAEAAAAGDAGQANDAGANGAGLRRRKRKGKKGKADEGKGDEGGANTDLVCAPCEPSTDAPATADLFTDDVIASSRKVAKMFNLSEEQFEQAVRDAKTEMKTGVKPTMYENDYGDLAGAVNTFILAVLVGALIWAINRDYGNAFTIWFVRKFPRESAVLNIGQQYAAQGLTSGLGPMLGGNRRV